LKSEPAVGVGCGGDFFAGARRGEGNKDALIDRAILIDNYAMNAAGAGFLG
jgi:hypothetical protein